jgi:large subunit ribosomal protein L29
MTAAELRQKKDDAELVAMGKSMREELFKLKMQHHTGQLDKSSRLKELRRDIARVQMVLRERELAANNVQRG